MRYPLPRGRERRRGGASVGMTGVGIAELLREIFRHRALGFF